MKLLVTGGAGFIGSNFVRYILAEHKEYQVLCIDKLTYAGNIKNLSDVFVNDRFHFKKIDICDKERIEDIFNQFEPDMVVNFAAESHVDRSIDEPEAFLMTNVIGTQVLLDACRKYGIKRFHQISTDEVYGDLPLERKDLLFTEDTPLKASSPYSASKAAADLLVQAYYRTYNLPITISRCSNNYGAYQFPEKLIPLMIIKAVNGEELPVYGTGENVRDWLHVLDHCKAVDLILQKGKEGQVYNIGGSNEKTNISIVKKIIEYTNSSEKQIQFVEDRKGHDLRYGIDASRIMNEIGWKPSISFEEGIEETIQWYLSNNDWWENILSGAYLCANSEISD